MGKLNPIFLFKTKQNPDSDLKKKKAFELICTVYIHSHFLVVKMVPEVSFPPQKTCQAILVRVANKEQATISILKYNFSFVLITSNFL